MSQIRPESLHIAPFDGLPGSATREGIRSSDYVRIGRLEDIDAQLGADGGRVVIECPPELVAALAGKGHLVVVCPDDLGARPGGELEAVVTQALIDGARIVRSEHQTEVTRCMHLTAALMLERQRVST